MPLASWPPNLRLLNACILSLAALRAVSATLALDVIIEDARQFGQFLRSPAAERRIEGIQGLSHLKYRPAESDLIPMLRDSSLGVRREALLALGRLGTAGAVPHLIALLDDPAWEIRQNAWLSLAAMTGQNFPSDQKQNWQQWWDSSASSAKEQALHHWVRSFSDSPAIADRRRVALRALRTFASASSESFCVDLLQKPQQPPLDQEERALVCESLERIGSRNAIPALSQETSDAAAWALAEIGGADAEKALLRFPKTLPVLLALDHLNSTNTAPFLPQLVAHMGLITYRGQPDDVMIRDLQPIQRVSAHLIRRSGLAADLIEGVIEELEDSMSPPLAHSPRPAFPPSWNLMFVAMRQEVTPGFVRNDGTTTSQPLAALCYTADDPALAKRLVPLIRHPAFVARVYVALALGRLHAVEALPALVEMIREGYSFSDSVALASGKHFDKSQSVRWRGFFCLAIGRMGGESARQALEQFAADPTQPRDVRYGAAVGLGFLRSPKSLPILHQIARQDLIWMVRDAARQAEEEILLLAQEEKK